jgi:hypothetical protein
MDIGSVGDQDQEYKRGTLIVVAVVIQNVTTGVQHIWIK